MPGSSILPVAIHNNKLYFLFGKENSLEDSAPGFSDFGGGIEKGETAFETAVREGSEELTGFLGTSTQIKRHMKKMGGSYAFTHTNAKNSKLNYTVHVVKYPYDENLPFYYNNNHHFLWNKMNRKFLKSTKLFEKIEIEWFCEDELKKRMSEYRPFYREVVNMLLQKLPEIKDFLNKLPTKGTRKQRTPGRKYLRNKSIKRITRKMKGG
jgi:8-oxo-dGTP pyrophosphatase MutT (NUDIX family)